MKKRGKIRLSVVVISLLFIIFSFYFVVAGNNNWIIEGNKVYVDNNEVYISAQPHTIKERGYVYFNITSKQYEGDVDIVFGFNTPLLKPTKAELYKPEWKNRTESYICENDYFNYTSNPKHAWCYRNKTNKNNETIDELELIYEHEFEWGNLNEKTIYWNESYLDEWKDISQTFSSTDYDYGRMNKWYYVKDIPIEKNKNYLVRGFIEIPRGKGFSPINLDEKYWFAIKPSSETLQQAITNNHLYALDPWINSSGANQNKDYLSANLIAYWKMENQSEEINSSYYNLTAFRSDVGIPTFDTGIIGNGSVHPGTWNIGWNTTKYNNDMNFNQTGANFTISFWTKEANANTQAFISDIFEGGDLGWCIMLINGKVRWYDPAQNEVYAANNLNLNTWQYVTIIRNSSNLCIFVNATKENCVARTGDMAGYAASLLMGVHPPAGNYPLNGTLDEIGIWKRALNISEILDLYNNGLGITYSPIAPDTTHPIWKNNWTSAINQTKKGDIVHFNITLEDNTEGGNWIFSFFNDTTWQNNSGNWTGVNYTILNETRTIPAIKGSEIKWKWYFSDLAGNNNETPIWNFTVANTPPNQSQPMLTSPSEKNLSTENLTCYNLSTNDADNDNVTNIYNWYKNSQPLAVLNLPLEINANDYSGNSNDGTLKPNITNGPQFVTGEYGKALSFDGIDDYIEIEDSDSLDFSNQKTWQLWLRRNSTGEETLFDKSSEGKSNYKLEFLSDNLLKFSYSLLPSWVSDLWQFDLSKGDYYQTYYNTTENAVMLNNSYNGDYKSKVFNDSGKALAFKTISFSADVPTVAELDVEDKMLVLWHLNENAGSKVYDETTYSQNGTITGATWISSKSGFNSALDFDGDNDYFVSDTNSVFNAQGTFSIGVWVNFNSFSSNQVIWSSKSGVNTGWFYLYYDSSVDKLRFLRYISGYRYLDSDVLNWNTGDWHYIVIIQNSSDAESHMYIDGSLENSDSWAFNSVDNHGLRIGSDYIGGYDLNATIDEIAIWNKSLSASEIQEDYNNGIGAITNLSLSVRSCDDDACSGESWTEILGESPQDLTLDNNTFFQFKAEFDTNDTNYSPKLYNVTLNYSAQTLETEANITSTTAITNDNQWHLITVTFNETGENNLKIYLDNKTEPDSQKTEINKPNYTDNNLTIAKFFNGSIDEFRIYQEALTPQQIFNNHLLKYNTIVSEETIGGDDWKCSVTPNDGEEDGETKDSNNLSVLWVIEFDVTNGDTSEQEVNFEIDCDNGFSVSGVDSPATYGFEPDNYVCVFTRLNRFDKTIIFTADNDKTVNVVLSVSGFLSEEEHTWLEAIYECIINKNCELYNLLLEINQTIGNIWEHIKPTDESVIINESIINKVVNVTSNLTIDYTVNIPIKAGYGTGDYLPVRIGFWFLDTNNITCYNQGSKPAGVEDPYCQPLVIETIGPMGGSISFIVKLHPSLPVGNYNIKRMIDIDPNRVWINYGQETISMITLTETLNNPSISLEKTGETIPSSNQPSQSSSGGGGGSSVTNVYNIYNVTNVVKENKENEREKKSEANEEELEGTAGITGAIIGAGKQLMSGGHLVAIIAIIGGVLVVLIISRTIIRLKKK